MCVDVFWFTNIFSHRFLLALVVRTTEWWVAGELLVRGLASRATGQQEELTKRAIC